MPPIQIPYKNIFLTGASSGVGQMISLLLTGLGIQHHAPSRAELDLDFPLFVKNYQMPTGIDCLINCAAHDVNGKQPFDKHDADSVIDIVNCNLLAPMLLVQKLLANDPRACVVNITSTNNQAYPGHDLTYSLTKRALSSFGELLARDYPDARILEVCLGLTRTNFNANRFRDRPDLFQPDFYNQPCLTAEQAATGILAAVADTDCSFRRLAHD